MLFLVLKLLIVENDSADNELPVGTTYFLKRINSINFRMVNSIERSQKLCFILCMHKKRVWCFHSDTWWLYPVNTAISYTIRDVKLQVSFIRKLGILCVLYVSRMQREIPA